MKKNIKSLIFPTKKAEAYGGSLYHEIVYLGLKLFPFDVVIYERITL